MTPSLLPGLNGETCTTCGIIHDPFSVLLDASETTYTTLPLSSNVCKLSPPLLNAILQICEGFAGNSHKTLCKVANRRGITNQWWKFEVARNNTIVINLPDVDVPCFPTRAQTSVVAIVSHALDVVAMSIFFVDESKSGFLWQAQLYIEGQNQNLRWEPRGVPCQWRTSKLKGQRA